MDYVSKDTKVTISFAVLVFMGILWSLKEQQNVQLSISSVQRDILEIKRDLQRTQTTMNDRWTRSDMMSWVQLLSANNPSIIAPKIER